MKRIVAFSLVVGLYSSSVIAQAPFEEIQEIGRAVLTDTVKNLQQDNNGFSFEASITQSNSKYADYGVCFFRGKFVIYSARKVGAVGKKDPRTKEPYTKLYCSDVKGDWDLDRPLLFSRILNKNESLGSLTFNDKETIVFFTKGKKGNSGRLELYRADMSEEQVGKWENFTAAPFNGDYSVETPHLGPDGKTLYFASDMPQSKGGFDIFMVEVMEDGSYGPVKPVPGDINTEADEKFPHTSIDGKFLYFSSTGHQAIGGYDVYKSRRTPEGFQLVINLGNTINTQFDELAFVPATDTDAYMTSDRENGLGGYDIYKITEFIKLNQQVRGRALGFDSKSPLESATVRLVDTDGNEVARAITDASGDYSFPISSFEYYTVLAEKDGYQTGVTIFNSDNVTEVFSVDVSLKKK